MTALLEKIILTLRTYHKAGQFIKRQNKPEEIQKVQNEKLRKLINYCYENIKYYRELFDEHCIRPDAIKTAADLVKVPILTKEELRSRFWDFLPKQLTPCRVSRNVLVTHIVRVLVPSSLRGTRPILPPKHCPSERSLVPLWYQNKDTRAS